MNTMPRPNILWFYCDQLRADALSCYASGLSARTPHLDALAERGVLFENCFCNSPICVPSRTSTLTATYPEANGVYGNEGAWASYPFDGSFQTFPEQFAAAGYRTVNVGKTHVPRGLQPWQTSDRAGSEMARFYDGVDKAEMELVTTPALKTALAGRFPEGRPFPGEQVTENAVTWLNRLAADADVPFLLRVAHLQPHAPVAPPPPYDLLYDDLNWADGMDRDRDQSVFEHRIAEIQQAEHLSPDQIRRTHVAYHGLVAWLDDQVGVVLGALERLGLAERTIVVFESDHGVAIGEGGCFTKQVFQPAVHRVPRIVAWPGSLPQGERRADTNQSLDLARTLCDLASVAPVDTFAGRALFRDLAPAPAFASIGYGLPNSRALPNNQLGDWLDGGGWPRRACVRTDRFRLDMNVRRNGAPVPFGEEDIFMVDRSIDPEERRNIVADPAYADSLEDLRQRLLAHCSDATEPRFVPEYSPAERGED